MKQRSLQSKLFIAYLGMASLILFAFAAFFYLFISGGSLKYHKKNKYANLLL